MASKDRALNQTGGDPETAAELAPEVRHEFYLSDLPVPSWPGHLNPASKLISQTARSTPWGALGFITRATSVATDQRLLCARIASVFPGVPPGVVPSMRGTQGKGED